MPQPVFVVVGGSLAGLRACEQLRQEGFSGRLIVVEQSGRAFYDRPPLSKQFLTGDMDESGINLRGETAIEALELELLLNVRAVALDTERRVVELDGEHDVIYDGLVVATGARPRVPRGFAEGPAVLTLRSDEDARTLRERCADGPLVVIGGGFLGMEVASSVRRLGVEVTVIEAVPLPLEAVLGTLLASQLLGRQRGDGVRFELGRTVVSMNETSSEVVLRLDDGRLLEAATVLVATGVETSTGWLEGSKVQLSDGVVCDESLFCAPGVVAAGDLCRFPSPQGASSIRIEHWTNAAEQGAHAASNLVRNERRPYRPVPYFWSDHYGVKLQAIGVFSGSDRVHLVGEAPTDEGLVVAYERSGKVVGAASINRPRALMSLRPLVEAMAPIDQLPAAR